jgi:flagellar biosynthesis protein FlhF
MEYFTEQAFTYSECLQKIRSKYGERAKVLMQKSVRLGGLFGFFSREGVEMSGIISNDYTRYTTSGASPRKPADFEEEKKKFLAAAKGQDPAKGPDPVLQQLLTEMRSEVRTIKEKIESGLPAAEEEHPSLVRLREILSQNDFTPGYSKNILERARKEFSLEALEDFKAVQDKVVEWIGESIRPYREDQFQRRPRILVLVGPTGVGKTTTIAKLAAIYGLGSTGRQPLSVRMITIDSYRIGAQTQIETYGNIMGIPVSCVENYEDLREAIIRYSDGVDMILVDTIGKSPRDAVKLAEMQKLLEVCGASAEVYLALAATTKSSDMGEILRQFEPFGYRSVIVTKLDETFRVGNVISALADRGKSVAYITEGQQVPKDIQKAHAVRFLINLEGFKIDRAKIEQLFPGDESNLIKWR